MPTSCPRCRKQFKGQSIGTHATYCKVTEPELFWNLVERGEGCWLWKGALHRDGYGRFNRSRKGGMVIAHRYAWILANGAIPEGMDVLHSCDNPPCCNPAHMRLGTHDENMMEKQIRGRGHKLNADKAREIKRRFQRYGPRKTNAQELAAEFGVLPATIWSIATGRLWRHV